jgi:hypothetical protein
MFDYTLQQYENAVDQVTKFFAKKYFGDYYEYDKSDWVSCEIGGVICINDYWFNLEDMLNFLKYNYSKKDMFAYYDYALEAREDKRSKLRKVYMLITDKYYNDNPVCIRDWKKLKKKGII